MKGVVTLNLSTAQNSYLLELLQTSSVANVSTGLASVLLHLQSLGAGELLTVSLLCAGQWYDHPEATSGLLLLKNSELQEGVDTYTLLSNTLAEAVTTLNSLGNESEEQALQDAQSLTAGVELPNM